MVRVIMLRVIGLSGVDSIEQAAARQPVLPGQATIPAFGRAMELLASTTNPFGGVMPDPKVLPKGPDVFRKRLEHSVAAWEGEGYQVVWLEVPIARATLVAVAVEAGFTYHHAEEGYVLLTRRLAEGAFIPPYATHYVGVGGVVLNDARELLVVSERYRGRSRGPSYKLPGGALHPGEHIAAAAIREVREETGVRTRLEALVCFRHWHGYRFGKSDIYFVCRLSPLSQDISMQVEEIEECLWMPVEEYLSSEDVSTFNKTIVQAALHSPGIVSTSVEGYDGDLSREFFMPPEAPQR